MRLAADATGAGRLPHPCSTGRAFNPACGDRVTVDVAVEGGRITGIAQNKFPLDVKYQEIYREPGRVGYRLQATLKATAPAGSFKHELLLQTNDPASLLVPVLIEGSIQAALTVAPAAVKFDAVKLGEAAARRVIVNGNGQKPFRIVQIEGLPDGMTADWAPTPGPVQVLTLTWRPKQAGTVKTDVQVRTDLDGGAAAAIAVEAAANP